MLSFQSREFRRSFFAQVIVAAAKIVHLKFRIVFAFFRSIHIRIAKKFFLHFSRKFSFAGNPTFKQNVFEVKDNIPRSVGRTLIMSIMKNGF